MGPLRLPMRMLRGRFSAELLYWKVRSNVKASRQFIRENCKSAGFRKRSTRQPLILGVLGGYPFLNYVQLGYDWLGAYYNPCLLFDEVHYFQLNIDRERQLDFDYPFYIHSIGTDKDLYDLCLERGINVLRAYDAVMGSRAFLVGKKLNIPVIVSIH